MNGLARACSETANSIGRFVGSKELVGLRSPRRPAPHPTALKTLDELVGIHCAAPHPTNLDPG
jgi:hypothetical protein